MAHYVDLFFWFVFASLVSVTGSYTEDGRANLRLRTVLFRPSDRARLKRKKRRCDLVFSVKAIACIFTANLSSRDVCFKYFSERNRPFYSCLLVNSQLVCLPPVMFS